MTDSNSNVDVKLAFPLWKGIVTVVVGLILWVLFYGSYLRRLDWH